MKRTTWTTPARRSSVYMELTVQPFAVVQGTWAYAAGNSYTHRGVRYNSSGAQNDGCIYLVDLAAGTYTLDMFLGAQPSGAIATIDVSADDGATWIAIGTYDTYSAANDSPHEFRTTGVVIPTACAARLRLRLLTRNGSSSGWGVQLQSANWTRTA